MKRTYNIPLRKEFLKAPVHQRSKKAISAVISFLKKHMKSETVKIGKNLNEKVWEKGIKSPPHHIEVVAIKEDDIVRAELVGFEKELEKPKEESDKKPKADKPAENLEEAVEK